MPSDAICVLHTQIPREPRTEPNEPRFRKILLGLVSVYWLLISVRSRSRPRSKKPDRYRFEPPNRYRAPSSLGSFAGLSPTRGSVVTRTHLQFRRAIISCRIPFPHRYICGCLMITTSSIVPSNHGTHPD